MDGGMRAQERRMPRGPGVYLFRDARGRVLYVGKAASLRDRVASYLRGTPSDRKIARMVSLARSVEGHATPSEVDALLLEARWVREMQPRYNTLLRDDKSFPYLRVSGDPYPLVEVTREPPRPGERRFGPFADASGLRDALALLQPVFRFRTCDLAIRPDDPKRRFFRPCLLHAIDRCTAPCNGSITPGAYAKDIDRFVRFVRGEGRTILADLRRRMREASAALRYEEAATWRDRIRALLSLDRRGPGAREGTPDPFLRPADAVRQLQAVLGMQAPPRRIEGIDIATVHGEASVGSLVGFLDGIPDKLAYRRYRIRTVAGMNDPAMIGEVVRRRFVRLVREGGEVPDLLLVDGGPTQVGAAREAMRSAGAHEVVLIGLAKREELVYRSGAASPLRLPRHSPGLRLLQHVRDEAHRFAQHYHHLLRSRGLRGIRVDPRGRGAS